MRRHLPVIQPTALERRAFLLGVVGSVAAACAAEDTGGTQRRGYGSSGGSGGSPSDGGSSGATDGGGSSTSSSSSSSSSSTGGVPQPGTDAGQDAAPSPGCAVAGVDVGPPGNFAMGTVVYVAAANCFVGRDAGGLYAMYPLCTHTVGNLQVQGSVIRCLVHNATFDLNGQNPTAPATMPLPHFDICLKSNGNVLVDSKTIVPANKRLQA